MTYTAPDSLAIGHVHLKVTDLERSIAFYRDVLGLELKQRYGRQAAFLSAGDITTILVSTLGNPRGLAPHRGGRRVFTTWLSSILTAKALAVP